MECNLTPRGINKPSKLSWKGLWGVGSYSNCRNPFMNVSPSLGGLGWGCLKNTFATGTNKLFKALYWEWESQSIAHCLINFAYLIDKTGVVSFSTAPCAQGNVRVLLLCGYGFWLWLERLLHWKHLTGWCDLPMGRCLFFVKLRFRVYWQFIPVYRHGCCGWGCWVMRLTS